MNQRSPLWMSRGLNVARASVGCLTFVWRGSWSRIRFLRNGHFLPARLALGRVTEGFFRATFFAAHETQGQVGLAWGSLNFQTGHWGCQLPVSRTCIFLVTIVYFGLRTGPGTYLSTWGMDGWMGGWMDGYRGEGKPSLVENKSVQMTALWRSDVIF